MFRGRNGALVLVEVDEHRQVIADVHVLRHVALGKEYLTFLSAVKIEPEVDFLDYSEGIVVSEVEHINPSLRWMVRSVMLARASSWVTMTKVWPNWLRRSKKS